MPPQIGAFLSKVLIQHKPHIQAHDHGIPSNGWPPPSLTNDILPILKIRWARGPYQYFDEPWHQNLTPALRLASLFLSEDYPLLWFSRFTFSERRVKTYNPPRYYVKPQKFADTPEALRTVKSNITKLGRVITLMWEPLGYNDVTRGAYGLTCGKKNGLPWYYDFRKSDWPEVIQDGHLHPSVVVNAVFRKFFRERFHEASMAERYRAWFSFAITLVHEIAHAYFIWLRGHIGKEEPLWTIDENNPELGFSWETHVIGRVIDLLYSEVMAKGQFKHLMSTQTERLRSPEDVHQKQNAMHQENDTPFTLLYGDYDVPLLKPSEFRGNVRFVVKDADADLNFIACIRAIPVAWVMHWFQTE